MCIPQSNIMFLPPTVTITQLFPTSCPAPVKQGQLHTHTHTSTITQPLQAHTYPSQSLVHICTRILLNHTYSYTRTFPSQSSALHLISTTRYSTPPAPQIKLFNTTPSIDHHSTMKIYPSLQSKAKENTHTHTYPSQPSALHPISTPRYSTPIHQSLRYLSLIAHYSNRNLHITIRVERILFWLRSGEWCT